ncbi:MAG: histidine kinase [Nitrospirae bacterium GWC2_57_13]|jgi:signal-transduction protein with cAMP-binding, CBS, and nucleotidyltransferase domain|nr:MAG: histidine kinase [Nitrospirae bacterium GWC1_57_7]OGW27570.1 MAG: histidine kinase [Nitrospirae bacterium GWC2_57_13]HAS55492.1 histidine kinase [Nitrospiraceae bacterium]
MNIKISVRQVLQAKGGGYWWIAPQAMAFEALEIMAEKDVGALLVVDNGKLAGIFSERDYARKVILKGKASKQTPVGELMTTPVICVGPEQTIEECMALMSAKRVRHLPVREKGGLIGVVSIGDIVNTIIAEQDATIRDLENYIWGGEFEQAPVHQL